MADDDAAVPPTGLPSIANTPLDFSSMRAAFTPEEINRIKLTLLTGVDVPSKIEALRKLALSPVGAEEKGYLALKTLTDSAPEVRREAVVLLESMGLNRDLADALKSAASGSARQQEMAIGRIRLLGGRAAPSERSVAVAFLAGALAHEKDRTVLKEMIVTLAGFADLIAGHPDLLGTTARNLTKILADHYDDLSSPTRKLLDAIAVQENPDRARIIWREAEGVGDRRMRILFLEALFAMTLPEELERELCSRALEELSKGPLEDLESRRLADSLRMRGRAALTALLDLVASSNEDGRALLIPVLDTVASSDGIPDDLRDRTGEYMLTLLREGSRTVRTAIIEARLCWHPKLSREIKKKLTADFIVNLHAYRATRIHDLTADAIRRIGIDSTEALKSCILKSAYPLERDLAAHLLSEVADNEAKSSAVVGEIILFLRGLETSDRIPIGKVVRCVGRSAHGVATPAGIVDEVLREYSGRIGKVPYNFDVIAAVGWLASSAACDPAGASDVALRFMDLLESPMPDLEVNETRTEEGTHLFVGAQTSVYTDLLPEIMGGLGRICVAGRLHSHTRSGIVHRLAAKYDLLVGYQEIWAPGNIVELGEMLGSIARTPFATPPERERIINAVMGNLRNLSAVRVLSSVFTLNDETDPAYASLLGRFIDMIFVMIGKPEYQDRDDQRTLIEALGKVGGNRALGDSEKKSLERRDRIVETLLEQADRIRDARPLLKAIAASPHVPASLRQRLEGTPS